MSKVIPLRPRKKGQPSEKTTEMQLVELGDAIDSVIKDALREGLDPKEISGILAHRLGSLMSHLEEKGQLWPVCEKVLKSQAKID